MILARKAAANVTPGQISASAHTDGRWRALQDDNQWWFTDLQE